MQASASAYPATFTFDPPERVANWRPLVQWLLAIPHFIVLSALNAVSEVISVISWFAIVFTGRMPEGLANFQAMYLRYSIRTGTYAAFMREEYPPFEFDMTPADPGTDRRVRVDVRPELEGRNRVTVGFRIILAIPLLLWAALLGIAAIVVLIVGFFAVLFTGRWPEGLRAFIVNVLRWSVRFNAYFLLLTDEYPPFSLD